MSLPNPISPRTREGVCWNCHTAYEQILLTASFVEAAQQKAKIDGIEPAIDRLNKADDGVYVHSLACVPCTRLELQQELPMAGRVEEVSTRRYVEVQRTIAASRPRQMSSGDWYE